MRKKEGEREVHLKRESARSYDPETPVCTL